MREIFSTSTNAYTCQTFIVFRLTFGSIDPHLLALPCSSASSDVRWKYLHAQPSRPNTDLVWKLCKLKRTRKQMTRLQQSQQLSTHQTFVLAALLQNVSNESNDKVLMLCYRKKEQKCSNRVHTQSTSRASVAFPPHWFGRILFTITIGITH